MTRLKKWLRREKIMSEKPGNPGDTFFFDFECTLDSGIHVPNLCVAHMVRESCTEQLSDFQCSVFTSKKI
jgi:hypothetical protein